MKKKETLPVPPYEGEEPYLYLAFAEADRARVWKLLRPLLARGCRVWYCLGPAGNAEELLRRQARAEGAALTVVYLTDAACADQDTKSNILVNQKHGRALLCLDPDGVDRRLSMGLREDVPHLPLYRLRGEGETEQAILHAEGFSQALLGEPIDLGGGDELLKKLTRIFLALTLALALLGFVGVRYLHWFRPEARDEVTFSDPALLSAVRQAAGGGAITEELTRELRFLRLEALPESWEELALLPALERIELPQQALLEPVSLPEGDYTLELSGGEGA